VLSLNYQFYFDIHFVNFNMELTTANRFMRFGHIYLEFKYAGGIIRTSFQILSKTISQRIFSQSQLADARKIYNRANLP